MASRHLRSCTHSRICGYDDDAWSCPQDAVFPHWIQLFGVRGDTSIQRYFSVATSTNDIRARAIPGSEYAIQAM